MDRGDIFDLLGKTQVRFAEGTITRLFGTIAYVTCPGFDNGLEFQANFAGVTPVVGRTCVVAILTDTAEAWIISWDGPNVGITADFWHTIGSFGQPTFQNSWAFYGSVFVPPRFRKDAFGKVTVSGLVQKLTAAASGEVIFTLPAGYRPDTQTIFMTRGSNSSAGEVFTRIDVWPNGDVVFSNAGGSTWSYLSLDPIEFYVASPPASVLAGPQGAMGLPGPPGAGALLAPRATSVAYTAVSQDYVIATGGGYTITLPAPTANRIVGVKAVTANGTSVIAISTPSGVIRGEGVNTGATGIILGAPGAYVTLLADGTDWHIVAGEQDSGWIGISYAALYSDYGGGFTGGQYRKRGGRVDMRGLVKYATPGSYPVSGPLGNLPAGYRPAGNEIFDVVASSTTNGAFRLDINASGDIGAWVPLAGTGNWDGGYVSLAGLSFDAA